MQGLPSLRPNITALIFPCLGDPNYLIKLSITNVKEPHLAKSYNYPMMLLINSAIGCITHHTDIHVCMCVGIDVMFASALCLLTIADLI